MALLAILCSSAMAHLWQIVTFLVHQGRADTKAHDGLFRQQQALLRTMPSPATVFTDFGKLSWAWRSTGLKDNLGRSLPLILLAATFSVATVLVGIFSSYVVDGTDIQVLVNSPHCGGFNMDYSSRVAIDANYTPIVSELALAITQDCYNTDQNLNSARCRIYSKPRITLQSAREKCPWPSPMCTEKTEKPAITLDSGLLDVGDTFGINLPSGENIKFRRRTSCAVLPLENRTSVIPATKYPQSLRPLLPEEQFLIMSYGRYGEPAQKEDWLNATFVISLATTNVSDTFMVRYADFRLTPCMVIVCCLRIFVSLTSKQLQKSQLLQRRRVVRQQCTYSTTSAETKRLGPVNQASTEERCCVRLSH